MSTANNITIVITAIDMWELWSTVATLSVATERGQGAAAVRQSLPRSLVALSIRSSELRTPVVMGKSQIKYQV